MSHRLKTFSDRAAADKAAAKSKAAQGLIVMPLGRVHYLKLPSPGLGVEPKYLCADGRWRKYDLIVDLPHSTASMVSG